MLVNAKFSSSDVGHVSRVYYECSSFIASIMIRNVVEYVDLCSSV